MWVVRHRAHVTYVTKLIQLVVLSSIIVLCCGILTEPSKYYPCVKGEFLNGNPADIHDCHVVIPSVPRNEIPYLNLQIS